MCSNNPQRLYFIFGIEKVHRKRKFHYTKNFIRQKLPLRIHESNRFFYMCGIYALRAIARVSSRRLMRQCDVKTWNCVKIFQWKHNPNGLFQLECFLVWMCWWLKHSKRQQLHDKKGSWIWIKKSLQIKSMKAFRVWNMTDCCCFDRARYCRLSLLCASNKVSWRKH